MSSAPSVMQPAHAGSLAYEPLETDARIQMPGGGGGSTSSPSSSSSASSSSSRTTEILRSSASQRGAPLPTPAGYEREQEFQSIPLAGEGGLFSGNSYIGRCLMYLNCGLQDLRLLFMFLPCASILLLVTHQTAAGVVLLVLTFFLMTLIAYRLLLLLRARNLQAYSQLSRDSEGIPMHLGGLRYSQLMAQARMNPTAMRLAMMDRDFTGNDYEQLLRLDEEHRAQTFTGLPQSTIERLPTYAWPKQKVDPATGKPVEDNCSVCLEPKQEGEIVRALLCMHSFHVACIDPWLQQHTKCPVCQFAVQL